MFISHAVKELKTNVLLNICVYLIFYNAEASHKVISNTNAFKKTCILKPSRGPCRANLKMYYFNPKSGSCDKFVWGGCQGNGNRFDSERECRDWCMGNDKDKVGRPRYCFLNFDYGYCFGAIPRYYYDPLWKVCKERIYSGCGGNKNNFYTIEQCESICRFGNGVLKFTNRFDSRRNLFSTTTTATNKEDIQNITKPV